MSLISFTPKIALTLCSSLIPLLLATSSYSLAAVKTDNKCQHLFDKMEEAAKLAVEVTLPKMQTLVEPIKDVIFFGPIQLRKAKFGHSALDITELRSEIEKMQVAINALRVFLSPDEASALEGKLAELSQELDHAQPSSGDYSRKEVEVRQFFAAFYESNLQYIPTELVEDDIEHDNLSSVIDSCLRFFEISVVRAEILRAWREQLGFSEVEAEALFRNVHVILPYVIVPRDNEDLTD